MNKLDANYFLNASPNILSDDNELRQIQKDAYVKICHHFLLKKSKEHAIAILPTGSGKTGVMAIAPFGVSMGRVLIITPQLVIKDHVVDSLDASQPNNFWLRYKVFNNFNELPNVVEYDKDTFLSELDNSNIVILNIHKLSTKSRNSLLNRVEKDHFDMIIIDEAHHSPAQTWKKALQYFNNAKVLKVTGTPFRHDRKIIEGKEVINYRFGKAMHDGIVKTLKSFELKPEKLYLTIENDDSRKYTIQELEEENIKSKNYIQRSVAYSEECNQQIIDSSLYELNKRKNSSTIPHKIIAVCCSIPHAENVKKLYEKSGARAALVHSKQDKKITIEELRKVESHQIDVLIHVAMLGEGYDHQYLSIAAIFRPFKSLAPYSQFIGRILRRIPDNEVNSDIDNIGAVIAHKELGLRPLWEEYIKEKNFSEMAKQVKDSEKEQKDLDDELTKIIDLDIGDVITDGEITIESEYYEFTKAAQAYEEYEEDIRKKAEQLKTVFPDLDDKSRKDIARQETEPVFVNPLLKNPKKYRMILRAEVDNEIKLNIPTELLLENSLNKEGTELALLPVKKAHNWVLKDGDNAAIIAKYLNSVLRAKFGKRDTWTIADYQHAQKELNDIKGHLNKMISSIV